MTDVAIIGVETPPLRALSGEVGDRDGRRCGEVGAQGRRHRVERRPVRFRRELRGRQPGHAVVNLLGLTGIPFIDVYNGCATAASAISLAAKTIERGEYDIGVAVGMDKHMAGAFAADPVQYSLPAWYGETGLFLTTKFFGMKIQRYMHDHDISRETLAKVAAKAYRYGSRNPDAFRRSPVPEEMILRVRGC